MKIPFKRLLQEQMNECQVEERNILPHIKVMFRKCVAPFVLNGLVDNQKSFRIEPIF